MADVTGPISTLPGALREPPKGQMCDDHPDRPATFRCQGETDSFGSEMYDMCEECYRAYKEDMKTWDLSGTCEWCKAHKPRLSSKRDYEEGMYGRVYEVCDECIKRVNDEAEAELEAMGYYDDWDYDK
jgi:hypothetical protein